jgi:anaerobic selenocysteine-containing dehydrogenase
VEAITGVGSAEVEEAARLVWESRPLAYYAWSGVEMQTNSTQIARAIAQLSVLTGSFDARGGNVLFAAAPANDVVAGGLPARENGRPALGVAERPMGPARFGFITTDELYTGILERRPYAVRGMVGLGANLLLSHADGARGREALAGLEFYVHADLFMNPTAELADIVLPAAAWPELDQLAGLPTVAANVVLAQQKAVQVGECKPDEEIFVELARRMQLDGCTEPVKTVLDAQLAAGGLDLSFDELRKKGFIKVPFAYRKYEKEGFKTPTGKIELYATRFEKLGYSPLPHYEEPPESPISTPEIAMDFPLVLTTGARSPFFFNSEHRQIGKLRKAHRDPFAEIHPETAEHFGIGNGQWMWIATRRGRIRQRARVTTGIDRRVIHAQHGWWYPERGAPDYGVWDSNANLLTDNAPPYDPAMGTYQLRALLCRVEPCPSEPPGAASRA